MSFYDAQTKKEARRFTVDGAPAGIVFSADGKRGYTTDLKNNKVLAIDLKSLKVTGETTVDKLSDGIGITR